MQIYPALVVDLLTTNYELTILDLHRKIRVGESGDRQGNAQPVVAELLDVVGRITVCRLGGAVDCLLALLGTEQVRALDEGQTRHNSEERRGGKERDSQSKSGWS